MKYMVVLFLFLLTFSVYPANKIAVVKKMRGKATMLLPGVYDAKIVKLGDALLEDTSVVTENSSFVQIEFKDHSTMNIGPNSQAVIRTLENQEGNLISLLKGKLRAEVKKKSNHNIKMVVKTRTAALGVRGTDFQSVYNPTNRVTSLLTFDGEVAMKKITGKEMVTEVVKSETVVSEKMLTNPAKVFSENDSVLVKKGRYSGVSDNMAATSSPVKIAPKQFVALQENTTFGTEKNLDLKMTDEKIQQAATEINQVKDVPMPDAVNEVPIMKSGGLVDLETGIYVPPAQDAKFNEKLNVYEADPKMGDCDMAGKYIPPKGLELTPTGFVVKEDMLNDKKELDMSKKELMAMTEDLNKNINETIQIEPSRDEKFAEIVGSTKSKSWYSPQNHIVSFKLGVGGHDTKIKVTNKSNGEVREKDFKSDGGSYLEAIWGQVWTDKWETYIGIGRLAAEYKDLGNQFNMDNHTDSNFMRAIFGLKYRISKRMKIYFQPTIEDTPVVKFHPHWGGPVDDFDANANIESFAKIYTGIEGVFYTGEKWDFGGNIGLTFIGSSEDNYSDNGGSDKWTFDSSVGANMGLNAIYKFRESKDLVFFFKAENENQNAKHQAGYLTFDEEINNKRNLGLLGFNFLWRL